ncbi:unnamed protein product [Meganyctiphanes norvegica]|uniref:Uncharacterized protein n=1 Tax=Meganyctiphanes norvegica TaxID=48144 RepID=A0AAV2SIL7_MEGNR
MRCCRCLYACNGAMAVTIIGLTTGISFLKPFLEGIVIGTMAIMIAALVIALLFVITRRTPGSICPYICIGVMAYIIIGLALTTLYLLFNVTEYVLGAMAIVNSGLVMALVIACSIVYDYTSSPVEELSYVSADDSDKDTVCPSAPAEPVSTTRWYKA